jgi:ankyrin repeat protein
MVQSLLLKGANINVRDRDGKTPLALVQQEIKRPRVLGNHRHRICYITRRPNLADVETVETVLKEKGGIL